MSKKQKQHQQIVPGNALAIKVCGTEREDLGYALKAWKRKVKSSGILEATKERKEFTKPTAKRRAVLQRAEFIQMIRTKNAE